MLNEVLHTHVFVFNKEDNSGESLSLTTKFFSNGDPGGIYTIQELVLQSYCNRATFGLHGATITPEELRKLANELESAKTKLSATPIKLVKPKEPSCM